MSREAVTVPPDHAAEMAPYLAMVGEFRVHYAGLLRPRLRRRARPGSRGVLEVRCHEAPFALEHGQVVGRLVYERMAEVPDLLYGRGIASNYQGQGLKLSKHFRGRRAPSSGSGSGRLRPPPGPGEEARRAQVVQPGQVASRAPSPNWSRKASVDDVGDGPARRLRGGGRAGPSPSRRSWSSVPRLTETPRMSSISARVTGAW